MAITYSLAPIPKWIVINNQGTTAGGARMATKRSLNKVQDKAVYQDAGGTIPYTNPVIFDANGTAGPFYWAVDSATPEDTYFLDITDSNGNPLYTVDDFFPPGSGGGGSTTTYIPLNNMIANNVFIDHIDDTANPTNTTNLILAPSNHHGLVECPGTWGVVGPDIRFVKNNTAATDKISFGTFTLGTPVLTGDVTPVNYIRYQCTNSPVGETFKSFQFPICQKVNNLSGQVVTFILWAAVTATAANIVGYSRQFFGSGGAPSSEVRTSFTTMSLTTAWQPFVVDFTIPSVSGKTLGSCGNDALYIQIDMPLGTPCDILFTKPALYLGNIEPNLDFDTYDQIDSITQTARTGDVKTSFLSSAPKGWVRMDDGSIGSASSGATTRANIDTFSLYATLYTGVSDTYAPVSGGRSGSGTTISEAITDFNANKTLTLPLSLGCALAGAGAGSGLTSRALGENTGAETVVLTAGQLASHAHGAGSYAVSRGVSTSDGVDFDIYRTGQSPPSATRIIPVTGTSSLFGNNEGHPNMQPTSFMNVFIKL